MTDQMTAFESLRQALKEICLAGPVPAVGKSHNAVGMTLLKALGIPYNSREKPNFMGIVVNARRSLRENTNRVNLFAQVPNWKISSIKSSKNILAAYGYHSIPSGLKLYCTVRADRVNRQGLFLEIDSRNRLLHEKAARDREELPVASWNLETLESRLMETHPASMWVRAVPVNQLGQECFHYLEALYSGPPDSTRFSFLLERGMITLDHLIMEKDGRVSEKGPLFKINPRNISALFPASRLFSLFS